MTDDVNIIWRKNDAEMPEKAQHVVVAAQDELLLKTLQLPLDVVDTIRYNANKNAQTINDYIAAIVLGHFKTA